MLGWPWAIKKFIDFKLYFRYIGFDWSITNKTVELFQEKKEKYHQLGGGKETKWNPSLVSLWKIWKPTNIHRHTKSHHIGSTPRL